VRFLLENGADANNCSVPGITMLGFAAKMGNGEIIHLLAQHGCDIPLFLMEEGQKYIFLAGQTLIRKIRMGRPKLISFLRLLQFKLSRNLVLVIPSHLPFPNY
jgi:ankyrin repeat protein